MNNRYKAILTDGLVTCLVIFISSCSTDVSSYENTTPKLDIKEYFTGEFVGYAMVQDYSNKVTRRFCVELNGTWDNNQGTLAETFYFNDGEITYRTWKLSKLANGQYTGKAEDVVGIAQGKQAGYAFNWRYSLSVPIDEDTYQFTMDDWMYKLDEHRVMNKTTMSKFGIDVAEITLLFDKSSNQKTCVKPLI
ncbi:DUF3833 domain-containing protein [Colwellia echini]|uniref:DUF3833 domain-containing protein n=1 Tax=Colwellia echini TaxID=1982103 RepID=A0ABY3MYD9_9GAMM|nr:DUF3833 domain-containing protein [Colwellia echini]TYK66212.1 DUF3833 domain-containing protein [Colwellia echini]